jgi:hypothetical protein
MFLHLFYFLASKTLWTWFVLCVFGRVLIKDGYKILNIFNYISKGTTLAYKASFEFDEYLFLGPVMPGHTSENTCI